MTPSELKTRIEESRLNPHFFDRKTMKFFGDTMRNYGVVSTEIVDTRGIIRQVYELSCKRPVKHGLCKSVYFDRKTFEIVHSQRG